MKKKILFLLLAGFILFPVPAILAQKNIVFEYDENGNCIVKRKTVVLRNLRSQPADMDNEEDVTLLGEECTDDIILYPNPTRGILILEKKGNLAGEKIRVVLLDMNGSVLKTESTSLEKYTFDMTTYRAGNYLLRVIYGNTSEEYKIIKE